MEKEKARNNQFIQRSTSIAITRAKKPGLGNSACIRDITVPGAVMAIFGGMIWKREMAPGCAKNMTCQLNKVIDPAMKRYVYRQSNICAERDKFSYSANLMNAILMRRYLAVLRQ